MSNAIFPSELPGIKLDARRTPIFSTLVQDSVSGRETRAALQAYPRWRFEVAFEFLHSDARAQLQEVLGFFLARRGRFDSFLFDFDEDNSVTGQQLGIGDGETTQYQLVRTLGVFTEPVRDINGLPAIYLDGVARESGWSMGISGLITFDAAPAEGAVITSDHNYYWRCRFVEDEADFERFLYKLWTLKKIEFISLK